jgi:hypothetical protein
MKNLYKVLINFIKDKPKEGLKGILLILIINPYEREG